MADLVAAAAKMADLVIPVAHRLRVRSRSCRTSWFGGGTGAQHARQALGLLAGHATLSSDGIWCRAWTHRGHTVRTRTVLPRRRANVRNRLASGALLRATNAAQIQSQCNAPKVWGASHLYSRLTNSPALPKCLFCKEKSKPAAIGPRQVRRATQ